MCTMLAAPVTAMLAVSGTQVYLVECTLSAGCAVLPRQSSTFRPIPLRAIEICPLLVALCHV